MTALLVLTLAAAFAVGTLLLGWWGVIAVALIVGVLLRAERRIALTCALAASLGWVLLLAWTTTRGPLLAFAGKLAGAMGVPAFVPLVLTVLFPAIVAWAGAAVGQGVALVAARRRTVSPRA